MDARAKWDQMLDQSPPLWARAARDVGDAVSTAASILIGETGGSHDHSAVVELARLIIERRDRLALLEEVDEVLMPSVADRLRPYCDHLPVCRRRHYVDNDDAAPDCDCGLLDIVEGR